LRMVGGRLEGHIWWVESLVLMGGGRDKVPTTNPQEARGLEVVGRGPQTWWSRPFPSFSPVR